MEETTVVLSEKASNAVNFLTDWSKWLAEIIAVITNFFDQIKEALGLGENA